MSRPGGNQTYDVIFTHQVKKKRKVWRDGKLFCSGQRVRGDPTIR